MMYLLSRVINPVNELAYASVAPMKMPNAENQVAPRRARENFVCPSTAIESSGSAYGTANPPSPNTASSPHNGFPNAARKIKDSPAGNASRPSAQCNPLEMANCVQPQTNRAKPHNPNAPRKNDNVRNVTLTGSCLGSADWRAIISTMAAAVGRATIAKKLKPRRMSRGASGLL